MADRPGTMRPTAGAAFFRFEPTEAAMLSNSELRETNRAGKFVSRIKVSHLLAFYQHAQHRFDSFKSLFKGHDGTL